MTTTFPIKKVDTIEIKIDLAIPPENPVIKGQIAVDCFLLPKDKVKELLESGLDDADFLPKIAKAIRGLGNESGPIEGKAAFDEVLTGQYSMYLLPAITQAYFEQFGEARRKNSKPLRGR